MKKFWSMQTPDRVAIRNGKTYTLNGCTRVWDWDFRECCDEHDIDYQDGGRGWLGAWRRFVADVKLRRCIACIARNRGYHVALFYYALSWVYFLGVRCFGFAFWHWIPKKERVPPHE